MAGTSGRHWPEGAREITAVNPADKRDVICVSPDSGAEDVAKAVEAARAALPGWRRTPPPERAKILRRAGVLMEERKDVLGELVTRECGKTVYVDFSGKLQRAQIDTD